jgi:hypothetical protein
MSFVNVGVAVSAKRLPADKKQSPAARIFIVVLVRMLTLLANC